jgi:hypothetical protein
VEEWQRRLVDPNWGGGKFGSYPGFAGPVGTAMLLGALPGMGYRQAFASSRLLPRFLRGRNLSNQVPFIPHAPGGSVVRGVRFGDRATPQDMAAHFSRTPGAVRPTGVFDMASKRGYLADRVLPRGARDMLRPRSYRDQSLRGVRPYRNPSGGIGLYKGTKTGTQQPLKEPNPFQRAAQWWRFNNPWM